jgi:hypothetical protein
MTREEMKKLFGLIRSEFKEFELTAERLDFWGVCFAGVTFDQARAGFVKHLQESSFLPKPNDILKHIPQMQKGIVIVGEKTGAELQAWKAEQARKFWQEYGNFEVSATPKQDRAQGLKPLKAMAKIVPAAPQDPTMTDADREAKIAILRRQKEEL